MPKGAKKVNGFILLFSAKSEERAAARRENVKEAARREKNEDRWLFMHSISVTGGTLVTINTLNQISDTSSARYPGGVAKQRD